MAKHQTRHCISLSSEIYDLLREYCEANKVPMSRVVENCIKAFFNSTAHIPKSHIEL